MKPINYSVLPIVKVLLIDIYYIIYLYHDSRELHNYDIIISFILTFDLQLSIFSRQSYFFFSNYNSYKYNQTNQKTIYSRLRIPYSQYNITIGLKYILVFCFLFK